MNKSNFLNKNIWLKYNANDLSGDLDPVSTSESNKEDNSYSIMRISFLIIWIKLATLNQQMQQVWQNTTQQHGSHRQQSYPSQAQPHYG